MWSAATSSLPWLLPSLALLAQTANGERPPPRVMLWLLDCEPATLVALAQHTDAVSAIALSLYWVGLDNATGAATLIDAGNTVAEIRSELDANLCRCGAHTRILAAIAEVVEQRASL